ncbi:hypothetical protein D3C71_230990 [compost metagenome]
MVVSNHRATMASRVEAPGSLDYFPSPPWWGRALGEALATMNMPLGVVCEEPAAGEGHLAHGLRDVFPHVVAFDIGAYPRRSGAVPIQMRDYLGSWPDRERGVIPPSWTVSNPPFGDKTAPFIRRACARSTVGVAMLLQLRLLEGKARHALFRECGLYATVVLPRKGSGLRKGVWVPGQSTATAYAWFIFVKPGVVPGWEGFDGEARQLWVDPDAAARLTRPSDAAFAGVRAAA